MSKYRIITGEDVSEEIYLKTWELDNRTFEDKDKLTKEQALEWFYASVKSILILWNDEDNELIIYKDDDGVLNYYEPEPGQEA